jgi:hypothetical protein
MKLDKIFIERDEQVINEQVINEQVKLPNNYVTDSWFNLATKRI